MAKKILTTHKGKATVKAYQMSHKEAIQLAKELRQEGYRVSVKSPKRKPGRITHPRSRARMD